MNKSGIGLLLVLVLFISMLGVAHGMTQSEWDMQCINKTISSEVTVYSSNSMDSDAGTLASGSYVKTSGFDPSTSLWEISYFQDGSVKIGYVASTDITVAVSSVTVDDGSVENIPDSIAGNREAIVSYLNSQYSDRVYSLHGNSIHVEAAVSQAGGEAELPQQPVVDAGEIMPVPDELQPIVQLGSKWTVILDGDAEKTVETSTISFSDTVRAREQLAVINAPRKGEVVMHAQPKSSSSVLGSVPTGSVVGVIKKGTNYSRIYYNGKVGCVLADTLNTLNMNREPLGAGILTRDGKVVMGEAVDILAGASKDARVVVSLPVGTEVVVWTKVRAYYEIEVLGMRLYVHGDSLTFREGLLPSYVTGEQMTLEILTGSDPVKQTGEEDAKTLDQGKNSTTEEYLERLGVDTGKEDTGSTFVAPDTSDFVIADRPGG